MKDRERQLLKEIDELHGELLSAPNGKHIGNGIILPPDGYGYRNNAKKLITKAHELHNEYNPEYLNLASIEALYHTLEKEVEYVVYKDDEANKSNAAKKRKLELVKEMNGATEQIKIDAFALFLKISELKERREL